jgi:hypothetical protein
MANGHGGYRPGSGRKPGSQQQNRQEAATFYYSIISDPAYQARIRRQAIAGELAPQLETLLHYYALGKPVDAVPYADKAFVDALMTTVWAHVTNRESIAAIQGVIDEWSGVTRLKLSA